MAFKKPTINKVKTDIQSALIYIRATKKFGKTTLFRDIVLEKFGDPAKGLLVGIGYEQGYTLLDNLNITQIESWKDAQELKEWLIKTKGKEHDIEIIGFDVVGELIPMVQKEVMRLSKKETGKPCKTFNSAYGGYAAPRNKLKEIIKQFYTDLKKAGFGIVAIEHTKVKNIKEKGEDGDGYNLLTSTLANDYEAIFGDVFDFVLTGYVDKNITDGKVVGSERRLYFRGDGFVDAGGRFKDGTVPEYIVFDKSNMAKDFIEIIEEGMRQSMSKPVSKDKFKKMQEEEMKERKEQSKEFIEESSENKVDVEKNKKLIEKIQANLNDIDTAKVKEIMTKHKITSLKDAESIETAALEEIIALI